MEIIAVIPEIYIKHRNVLCVWECSVSEC